MENFDENLFIGIKIISILSNCCCRLSGKDSSVWKLKYQIQKISHSHCDADDRSWCRLFFAVSHILKWTDGRGGRERLLKNWWMLPSRKVYSEKISIHTTSTIIVWRKERKGKEMKKNSFRYDVNCDILTKGGWFGWRGYGKNDVIQFSLIFIVSISLESWKIRRSCVREFPRNINLPQSQNFLYEKKR